MIASPNSYLAVFVLAGLITRCPSNLLSQSLQSKRDVGLAHSATPRIDGLMPSTIVAGSPDTRVDIIGSGLDGISQVNIVDRSDVWDQLTVTPGTGTHATVTLPRSYLREPQFLILSPELQTIGAQSILVFSRSLAQTRVDPQFEIQVAPDEFSSGGILDITGRAFNPKMRVALGRDGIAGFLLKSTFVDGSSLKATMPVGYIPGTDLFVAAISPDGETRSVSAPVQSSYPKRETEASQREAEAGPFPAQFNEQGMKLMKLRRYDDAAMKFVEAARSDVSSVWNVASLGPRSHAGGLFTNNAGFAFFRAGKFVESVFWLRRAIAIDPNRAVAYLNLGDALAKLNRNAEARQAYAKYLELAPNSKSAPDVKKKLDALPPSP